MVAGPKSCQRSNNSHHPTLSPALTNVFYRVISLKKMRRSAAVTSDSIRPDRSAVRKCGILYTCMIQASTTQAFRPRGSLVLPARRVAFLLPMTQTDLAPCTGELLMGFQEVCTIEVDLATMRNAMRQVTKPGRACCEPGDEHWVLRYRIAFMFGATEFKAFVVWTENGKTCRSAANIIPIGRVM
jgi:hypothetical protein